jgi:hypothetical protein
VQGHTVHHVDTFAVAALKEGMQSGLPSVAFIIELKNGEYVFAQTSLRLFLTAADAFRVHYGDPRKE